MSDGLNRQHFLVADTHNETTSYAHFHELGEALRGVEAIVNEQLTSDVRVYQLTEVSVPALTTLAAR